MRHNGENIRISGTSCISYQRAAYNACIENMDVRIDILCVCLSFKRIGILTLSKVGTTLFCI
jgi:hypothetical protein